LHQDVDPQAPTPPRCCNGRTGPRRGQWSFHAETMATARRTAPVGAQQPVDGQLLHGGRPTGTARPYDGCAAPVVDSPHIWWPVGNVLCIASDPTTTATRLELSASLQLCSISRRPPWPQNTPRTSTCRWRRVLSMPSVLAESPGSSICRRSIWGESQPRDESCLRLRRESTEAPRGGHDGVSPGVTGLWPASQRVAAALEVKWRSAVGGGRDRGRGLVWTVGLNGVLLRVDPRAVRTPAVSIGTAANHFPAVWAPGCCWRGVGPCRAFRRRHRAWLDRDGASVRQRPISLPGHDGRHHLILPALRARWQPEAVVARRGARPFRQRAGAVVGRC